jgi:alanine-synthesizing transaminase
MAAVPTFSRRLADELVPNRLARALERLRRQGAPVLDLTASNPTRAGFHYPEDLLQPLATPAGLLYEPEPFGLAPARAAIAQDFVRRGCPVSPDRVVLTASTSEAYSLLFKLLCNPGDQVLVPQPSYPLFDHLTRLEGVEARPYALEYHGRWILDPDVVSAALTPAARAVVIVNPNNPTGSFLTRSELARLGVLAAARGIALIGDEVFFDYAFAGRPAEAISVLAQEQALAFSLGGLSKSGGLPQVKLGWMATAGPPEAVEAALARLEFIADAYLSVGTPVQHAAAALLDAGSRVREQIAARAVRNRQRLERIARRSPAIDVLEADGGWYAVLQVPALASEEELVLELLERDAVLVHPGYFFDFPREAFLVASLLPPEEVFAAACDRLFARLGGT